MSNQKPNPDDATATGPNADGMSQVSIPSRIEKKIEQRRAGTNFDSVDEYVAFVLDSLLREIDKADGERPPESRKEPESDTEGTEAVRNRLESLGYL